MSIRRSLLPRARPTGVALLGVVVLFGALGSPVAAARDSDHDGLPNRWEREKSRTSPQRKDTDRDGVADGQEHLDGDLLDNRQEYRSGTHPRRADTDRDGRRDDRENADGDALWNITEFLAGTSPTRKDSDGDGRGDGSEDPDRDGLTNKVEQGRGTHPRRADTDGDGYRDGIEVSAGTDPLDATSHPQPPAPPPDSDAGPTIPGAPDCGVFPASNVWNRRIDHLPVAADSGTLIGSIGLDRGLHMDFGSYAGYGIPFQVVDGTTPRSTVLFDYDDESDHVGYPIPAAPLVEGGSDRHILMVERDECRLYELFDARLVDGQWLAGSGATWDLDSNQLRPAGWTSADAAGLPILPGLVRYDEVAAGAIEHAVRFTTNQTRREYIYPARHYASSSTSAALPPMGTRVRLKAGYDTSGFSLHARVIAEALKRYGMILADNGSPWYISGMSDPRFDDDVMHELDVITGRDLEVVDTTGFVNGP